MAKKKEAAPPPKAVALRTEMIPLDKIVSNIAQSRGMGVLPGIQSLGYGLFEKKSADKKFIWELLFSEKPEDQKLICDLIEEQEPDIFSLAESQVMTGQLQAVGVRIVNEDDTEVSYDVIYGMRRVLAKAFWFAKHGKEEDEVVEAKIYDCSGMSEVDLKLMARDENDDRKEESILDRALFYQYLIDQKKGPKWTPEKIGKRVGLSDQSIRDYLKILDPLLADMRGRMHSGAISVNKALKLLKKRQEKKDATEDDVRKKEEGKRNRLPGAKEAMRLYEAKAKPEKMPEEEWSLWINPIVRQWVALRLGLPFTEWEPATDQAAKTNGEEHSNGEPEQAPTPSGKVMKVTRKRAVSVLVALGKEDATTWSDEVLKEKLEGITTFMTSSDQKLEDESLQKLLDKLVDAYKEGTTIQITEDKKPAASAKNKGKKA